MRGPETVLSGRYAPAERVGSGVMGEVWRAEDRVLERQVAVKILLPSRLGDRLGDDAFVTRFRREARVLTSIAHPGVVGVHDYGEHEFRRPLTRAGADQPRPYRRHLFRPDRGDRLSDDNREFSSDSGPRGSRSPCP